MSEVIDFVITSVDGSDTEWQHDRRQFEPLITSDTEDNRYRNWKNLQYLFRGIEKFAPWVGKVHLVVYKNVPEWLNAAHPKLHIVRHEDFIPSKWLPTFNNRCLELNLHRINGLSEQFVYFNDDMFLLKPVKETDFFVKGKPCDAGILCAYSSQFSDLNPIYLAPVYDTAVINKYFEPKEVLRKNIWKWLNPKYGIQNYRTLTLMAYPRFVGFYLPHIPYSYLKRSFHTVWEKEHGLCEKASEHRFRDVNDINQGLMGFWQLAEGNFHPRRFSAGKCISIKDQETAEEAVQMIRKGKFKMICLNDMIEDEHLFKPLSDMVNSELQRLLPEKSLFES